MSVLLQQLLVGVLVAGSALLAAWRLMSVSARLRTLTVLTATPGLRTAGWIARLRARTLALQTSACGGCAGGATRDATARSQTPGALRR
jgi:hypothetical protein